MLKRLGVVALLALAGCGAPQDGVVLPDGTVAPIAGECQTLNPIKAPEDAGEVCRYTDPSGGVVYMGRSILGDGTGALEQIEQMYVGDKVVIDGEEWSVSRINVFLTDDMPDRLRQEGAVSLVTMTADGIAEDSGQWHSNTVVELQ